MGLNHHGLGRDMRFERRTVIVTGGGSGIGRVMAQRFAAEGAAVVIADRFGSQAEAVAREVTVAGGKALASQTDVSLASQVEAMVDTAQEAFGPVDVLVNNAAVCTGDDLARTDEATWDSDVAVVLKSAFLCSKQVLPGMIEQGRGAIINIASVNGLAFL